MSDMQEHLLPEWRREIARIQTENEALRARAAELEEFIRDITKYLPRLANERARYVLSNGEGMSEIERLREIIRQNCNGDVVALANPNSAMPIDYKAAFERTAKSLELSNKAMRECQLLLCAQQEWGDCAKGLEAGERCACGFEDGPFANAVPKNREANQLRARVAELEKALNPFAAIAYRAEEMGWKADNSVLYVTLRPCLRARAVLERDQG